MAGAVATWSQTAASNSTADSTVNWREGQAPSTVNNSARAMMAAIAKWRDDISGNLLTGGSSTAYTLTSNQSLTPLVDGYCIVARMHTASGATPTLNVDSTGGKQIRAVLGTNISTAALASGGVYKFTYDSSDDAWIVNDRFADSFNGTSAPDLAAIELLTGTGVLKRTADNTWALTAGVTDLAATTANRLFGTSGAGASGLVTLTAPLSLASSALSVTTASDSATGVIEIATSAEMATGTDTGRAVVVGRQHFHPSAVKAHGLAVWSLGTPTLSGNVFNISSITNIGSGVVQFNFTNDFNGANYAAVGQTDDGNYTALSTRAASSIRVSCHDDSGAFEVPTSITSVICCGVLA